jgi:hypothetical protein
MFLGHKTSGVVRSFPFWALCCTRCGLMTHYADQTFIAQAYQATIEHMQSEQERLAKEAQKRQKR